MILGGNVAQNNGEGFFAHGFCRLDIIGFLHRKGLGPGNTPIKGKGRHSQGHHHIHKGGTQHRHNGQGQNNLGKGPNDIK